MPRFALTASDFASLPSAADFRQTLLSKLDCAQQRIYIAALYLEQDEAGQEILAARKSALLFHWKSLRRQVRIRGNVGLVTEACAVAKAARAAGLEAPIKTQWSREDDIRGGYYRPMHLHRAHIGLDAQGEVLAWDHVIVGQSKSLSTSVSNCGIRPLTLTDVTQVSSFPPFELTTSITTPRPTSLPLPDRLHRILPVAA